MSYRSILVHADGGPEVDARLRLAAQLARDFGAGLIGAAARLPAPIIEVYAGGAAMMSAGLMDISDESTRTAFAEAEARFNRAIDGSGLKTEWRSAIDFPAIAIAGMATVADLLVVGQSGSTEAFDIGDLVMKAGRPVLVAPSSAESVDAANTLVAWKNTAEARRALADSLPFLKRAKVVTLLHVGEGREAANAVEDAALFLRRHEIEPVVEVVDGGSRNAGEAIVAAAAGKQCGLIVLGAYGHSRLREWMFGGVTRDFLKDAPVPCLFSR